MTTWDTATLGAVCSTYSGGTPSTARPDYYGGDIPWIASADLNQGRITSVNGRITKLGLDRSSAKLAEVGTPLIALYGATAGVPAISYIRGAINQAVLAMVPKNIDTEYLYQWLKANRNEIIERYTQGGQPNLSGAIVRNVEIPLPPAAEQRSIGRALGDTDDLISLLEQMIAKKRAIKQGIMQKLMTGEKRLPGFTSPWQEGLNLTDVAQRFSGYWGASAGGLEVNTNIVRAGDVNADNRIAGYARRSLTRAQYERASCQPDDVVLTTSGTIGNVALVTTGDLTASNFVRVLRPNGAVVGSFLYYLLQTFRARSVMEANVGVSAMPNLRSSFFTDRWLSLPTKDEQLAISRVLRDADGEINLLDGRLSKARSMKAGMLQELLTCRTRLPVEERAA